MDSKVVFHVNRNEAETLKMAMSNMSNLFEALPERNVEARLVANGSGVELFRRDRASDYGSRIGELANAGVRFLMCNNSLEKHGIGKEELLESCEIVPAGIVEIIRLQSEGFAYVKP